MTERPAALPLFPLQAVLFPGGVLRLRIFEVRYLDMIGRCHREAAPFGVVSLTQGSEVQRPATPDTGAGAGEGAATGAGTGTDGATYAPEAFREVGTLARIDELRQAQAGLLMVRCTGTQRFRVQRSERLPHGLWTADAQAIPDDPQVPVPADLQPLGTALRRLLDRLVEQRPEPAGEMPLQPPYLWDDCAWLANRWSELLPLDAAARYRLMALDNPLLRLELVADTMAQLGFRPDG